MCKNIEIISIDQDTTVGYLIAFNKAFYKGTT